MTFWPGWTRTLDSMIASLARIRSRCRRCHVLVVDPGLPFRSRWQGMVPIVSAPLPSRAPAAVVELHPHIAVGADERIS